MRRVELTLAARNDLVRLQAFLVSKSERAAETAVETISSAVRSLAEFPERGRMLRGGRSRELTVRYGRDGYVLRYRIVEQSVFVYRIFHGRERR